MVLLNLLLNTEGPRHCPEMSSEYLEVNFNESIARLVNNFSEQDPEQNILIEY